MTSKIYFMFIPLLLKLLHTRNPLGICKIIYVLYLPFSDFLYNCCLCFGGKCRLDIKRQNNLLQNLAGFGPCGALKMYILTKGCLAFNE